LDLRANGSDEGVGKEVMGRLQNILRAARSRVGSRLAHFIAIAAASLPAAGA